MKSLLELLPRLPDDVMKQLAWICKNICKVPISEKIGLDIIFVLTQLCYRGSYPDALQGLELMTQSYPDKA
jgi:hypothetical protein